MIRKAIFQAKDSDGTHSVIEGAQSDYDAVWDVFHSVVSSGDTYLYSPNTPKSDLAKYWFGPHMHTYVYENADGAIVATYVLKPNQVDLGSHIANAGFMVNPDFQGKGIGSAMCEHCLATAKQLGFKAMQFNFVVSTNVVAIAVWKKFGFQIIGTIP
jgi:ribosomal protein S18 acetylase RimI-like enzyme